MVRGDTHAHTRPTLSSIFTADGGLEVKFEGVGTQVGAYNPQRPETACSTSGTTMAITFLYDHGG